MVGFWRSDRFVPPGNEYFLIRKASCSDQRVVAACFSFGAPGGARFYEAARPQPVPNGTHGAVKG